MGFGLVVPLEFRDDGCWTLVSAVKLLFGLPLADTAQP